MVVPAANQIYDQRRQNLGLETLTPWHMNISPHDGRAFYNSDTDLIAKLQQLFTHIHPRFGEHFAFITEQGLLDMASQSNRASRNFSTGLYQLRVPYVFLSLSNTTQDLPVLFHELGHAFHTIEMRELAYYQQLWPQTECAEVAAMVMELLGMQNLDIT